MGTCIRNNASLASTNTLTRFLTRRLPSVYATNNINHIYTSVGAVLLCTRDEQECVSVCVPMVDVHAVESITIVFIDAVATDLQVDAYNVYVLLRPRARSSV